MPTTEIGSGHIPAVERRTQDDVKRSLFRGDSILESMLVGIALAVDGSLAWVNETFARMLGYDRDELTGPPTSVLYPEGESFEVFGSAAYPLLRSGRPYVSEQQLKRKDGALIWVQCSGTAVDPKSPAHGAVWTSVDITQRKELQESLQRSLAERDVILQSTLVPPEEKEDLYRSIRGSVERMTRMLDNVLTIGRVEASMLEFSPAPADLATCCAQLADEMRRLAGGRHAIEFFYEGVRGPVRVDEKLLRHALSNLLSNAIKYSPDGGRGELRVAVDANEARFEVRDEGIGIPPEDQARLFETFHRARNVGTIAGTGLGLAIVKKSLELHGGSVTVESVPGLGTTFRVTVPLGGG